MKERSRWSPVMTAGGLGREYWRLPGMTVQRLTGWALLLSCVLGTGVTVHSVTMTSPPRAPITTDLLAEIYDFAPTALRFAAKWLTTTLKAEAAAADKVQRTASTRRFTSFRSVQSFLGGTPTAKQMSYSSFLQTKFLQLIRLRFNLDRIAVTYLQQRLPSLLSANLSPRRFSEVLVVPPPYICPYPQEVVCDGTALYRTPDGSCNNQRNPLWGSSFQPLNRFLRPDYADGIDLPRIAKTGQPLPNARLVSFTIHTDVDDPSKIHTLLFMLLGQFIDHDLSRTAISKLSIDENGFGGIEEVLCGDDGCQQGTVETQTCMPIAIPPNDPVFLSKPCLEFVRTLQVPNANQCALGPRQQLNQITSYLDSGNVYASTAAEALQLRDLTRPSRGRLLMQPHPLGGGMKDMLPPWPGFTLCQNTHGNMCFRAGDGRVNEHLGLMTLHTIFAREHNRIERILHVLNAHWTGERLYQETRRIVNAIWQRIVFDEYLPLLLGRILMDRAGLSLRKHGYSADYDPNIRPDIANGFTTAAFRFGHSQIQQFLQLIGRAHQANTSLFFSETFREPDVAYYDEGTDRVLRGFLTLFTQTIDSHITTQVTEHLFADSPPLGLGLDLAALNIQRGRDHGLPGYTSWRKWCRLGYPKSFEDLKQHMPHSVAERFATLYNDVDDIDVFPAAMSETPAYGAAVGPTFACIIATQFRNLKRGDRFWHENRDANPYPFTIDQLQALRKASLSRLICENSDGIQIIQPQALLQPFTQVWRSLWERGRMRELAEVYGLYHESWNERVACTDLPALDLSRWQERR